jgi:hypothetical protein
MNLKAALLATAIVAAFLLVAACGGDGGQSQAARPMDSTRSQPDSSAGDSADSGASGNGAAGGQSQVATPTDSTRSQADSSAGNPADSGPGGSGGAGAPVQYVAIDLASSQYAGASPFGMGIGDGEQVGSGGGANGHALLWRGSASSVVDLHPAGYFAGLPGGWFHSSTAVATSSGMQVGWGNHDDQPGHALKWAGSASSAVLIHPSGFRSSYATGISGDQIVGWGAPDNTTDVHALLWTSRGVVDLNPKGFTSSYATATDGAQQVGRSAHALLWAGSAESVVDLHPASGYLFSAATGVSGGEQVGYGDNGTAGSARALLWKGSAQSVVNLHPNGFRETRATGVAAGWQVGWGITSDGSAHALLWNGTAESVIDLHVFLPPGYRTSVAYGIDASGNVVGTAGGHPILWLRQ